MGSDALERKMRAWEFLPEKTQRQIRGYFSVEMVSRAFDVGFGDIGEISRYTGVPRATVSQVLLKRRRGWKRRRSPIDVYFNDEGDLRSLVRLYKYTHYISKESSAGVQAWRDNLATWALFRSNKSASPLALFLRGQE